MSLVGNKLDMSEKRQVKFQEAKNFANTKRVFLNLCRWATLKRVPSRR